MSKNEIMSFEDKNFMELVDKFVEGHEELQQYKDAESVMIEKCYNHPDWFYFVDEEYRESLGGY